MKEFLSWLKGNLSHVFSLVGIFLKICFFILYIPQYSEELKLKLRDLQSQGYEGKSLIHNLITDDFDAPPMSVTISGKGPNEDIVNEEILYR